MWFSFSSDLERSIEKLTATVAAQTQAIDALTVRLEKVYRPSPALVEAVAKVGAGAQANDDLIEDKPL